MTYLLQNNFDETLELTTYECQPCNKTFKNPVALQIHKRFHSGNFYCLLLKFSFVCSINNKFYFRIH